MIKKFSELDYKLILVISASIIIMYLIIVKPILPDSEERVTSDISDKLKSGGKVLKAFDKNFFAKIIKKKGYKSVKDYVNKINYDKTQLYSDVLTIYEAKGAFNDDETVLYNTIAAIPTIAALSMVSFAFESKYKKPLKTFLSSFMSEKELRKLYVIIDKKKEF